MEVSIFNDVVGPVMRGPSSSHCAAALRIGRLARDLMDGSIRTVLLEFDRNGSLPTTHESQGSDMGLFGGLMGWDAVDDRLPESGHHIREAGVDIRMEVVDAGDPHPNTYRLTLKNDAEEHTLVGLSTGGGMIEVIGIDGFILSIMGDYHVTLVRFAGDADAALSHIAESFDADEVLVHEGSGEVLIEIRAQAFAGDEVIEAIGQSGEIRTVKRLAPVLPVPSRKDLKLPFTSDQEMSAYEKDAERPLWELAVDYETARGGLSREEVLAKMVEIVRVVRKSVDEGIQGTEYEDRILGHQSGGFKEMMDQGTLLNGGLLNRAVLYVTALMEMKSSMGIIVAAPTAGACAAFPGAVLAAVEETGGTEEDAAKAMLAGGLIGMFIAKAYTFAAEVGGCQAEGGAAAGMTAAALVTLSGGGMRKATSAASMALQNMLGLICDPVANRVEVPCLGKNVTAAANALCTANMALAGFDCVIPLDEVIQTMKRVGNSMPRELRCTALGGLAITPTSKALELRLGCGANAGCGSCS